MTVQQCGDMQGFVGLMYAYTGLFPALYGYAPLCSVTYGY